MTAGKDGAPAWAYDEDNCCVCCGSGSWKLHYVGCRLRDALDAQDARDEGAAPVCPYGDPYCPCQDGDQCHYEGEDPATPPVRCKVIDWSEKVRNRLVVVCELPAGHEGPHHGVMYDGLTVSPHEWEPVRA